MFDEQNKNENETNWVDLVVPDPSNSNEEGNHEPEIDEEELEARKKVGTAMKKIGFMQGIMIGIIIAIVAVLLTALIVMKVTKTGPFEEETAAATSSDDNTALLDSATTEKLTTLNKYLQEYYYKDLDLDDLQEGLYKGLFEGTGDQYTEYYTPDEYKELQETTSGTFYGIGALLTQDKTTNVVTIEKVYPDSPAEKAGLQSGDVIEMVDSYTATDMSLTDLVSHIKGEEGSEVKVKILRDGKEKTYTVTRGEVQEICVDSRMLSDKVGYIQISEFSDVTVEQYEEAIESIKSQGAEAVVFDLRDNPGGTVDSVTTILDEILPEGTTVYTVDKNDKKEEYTSDAENYLDMPIAVLIDGNSASASEIFAGAIRDYDYGTLIGTTTYGKGIVQSILPFNDGSAIKLTTATYYTPSGECIHEKGIDPDIELEYKYTGEGTGTNYEYDKDNQVKKAMKVLTKELSK